MSMHLGFLLIKGDHLEHLGDIYRLFDLQPPVEEHIGLDFTAACELQYQEARTVKAATVINDWTVIVDFDMTLGVWEEQVIQLAKRYDTQVFTAVCEGISSSYGFALYAPEKVRGFLSEEGEINENIGDPLPSEVGIDYQNIFEDGVLQVMHGLGVDFEEKVDKAIFTTHIFTEENPAAVYAAHVAKPKKPWWKIW